MFGAMNDTCKVGTPATPAGPEPTGAYTYGAAIRCRFWQSIQVRETVDGSQFGLYDAHVELPAGTAVTSKSRIQLTHREGRALSSAQYYAVKGDPVELNPDVWPVRCELEKISGGSAL